jgi:hypothetical protein
VFLECVLVLCARACFGLSALKTLGCVKPEIGNLSKIAFSLSSTYVRSSSIHKVKKKLKTLTLTLIVVGNNSSHNTSTRSGATNFATCFKLCRGLSTTSREQKIDPLGLRKASRGQILH